MMKFSTAYADRLLGLADQFMEDWEANEGKRDSECVERRKEYDAIRPVFVLAPAMLSVLAAKYPGLELLPDGVFKLTRIIPDRRDWIGIARHEGDDKWGVAHNDCTDNQVEGNLYDALERLTQAADAAASEQTVRIEILPNQPNPASWCHEYIGQVFECYWFPAWGCWRIKDWRGRWDCTFREGYQAFRILPLSE